jgi:LysM repeat protein
VNKKLLLSIIPLLFILLAAFFILNTKRGNVSPLAKRDNLGSVSGLLSRAQTSEAKGNLLDAKNAYQILVAEFPNSSEIVKWQRKLEDINIKLLFSPSVTDKTILYDIRPGDTLTKIANEFKTTVDLIKKSNNLLNDNIVPGRKIKVWTVPFSILIDKSQNVLILKADEEVIKTYVVSTGTNNSTPTGNFKIVNKLTNPTWFKAGAVVSSGSPDNILGSRWLGFDLPGYGIHGTTEPQSLGKQVTQGCVRMFNADVEELYTIVPVGTEVTIVD